MLSVLEFCFALMSCLAIMAGALVVLVIAFRALIGCFAKNRRGGPADNPTPLMPHPNDQVRQVRASRTESGEILALLVVALVVLGCFWWISDRLGAAGDFSRRWVPLYFLSWIGGWLLMHSAMSVRWLREQDHSHFTRCVVAILLMWPLLGVATALAEEWTIAGRMVTCAEPSDTGFRCIYLETPSMGPAGGWAKAHWTVLRLLILGAVLSIAWLPTLVFSLAGWSRVAARRDKAKARDSADR